MSIGGVRRNAIWALLLTIAASPGGPAWAGDAPVPAAASTPIDLSPTATKPAGSDVDFARTGALKPQPPAPASRGISRLDLSPPPGFTRASRLRLRRRRSILAPVTFVLGPRRAKAAGRRLDGRESGADRRGDAIDLRLCARRPARCAVAGPPPISATAPADSLKPEASPAAAPTDVAAPTPLSASEALAGEVHAALDRFVAAAPVGRPIGAGDWSGARKAIAEVYAERAYAPLWIDGDHLSAGAKSALARLAKARRGWPRTGGAPPPADWTGAAPSAQAEADIEISAAVVAYAMQASGARVSPRSLSKDVSAKPEVADPSLCAEERGGRRRSRRCACGLQPARRRDIAHCVRL